MKHDLTPLEGGLGKVCSTCGRKFSLPALLVSWPEGEGLNEECRVGTLKAKLDKVQDDDHQKMRALGAISVLALGYQKEPLPEDHPVKLFGAYDDVEKLAKKNEAMRESLISALHWFARSPQGIVEMVKISPEIMENCFNNMANEIRTVLGWNKDGTL